MASEYWLDGVDLDQPGRYRVMLGTLLPAIPSPRTSSTEVPSRNGILDGAATVGGTFTISLNFMVEGENRANLEQNWVSLQRRLRQPRLMDLDYRPAGYGVRTTKVRLQSIAQPSFRYGEWIIETTAVLEAVRGVWQDKDATVQPLDNLAALTGGAAPITDPVLMLLPTGNTMTVKDQGSSTSITWRGTVPGGERIIVDVASYSAFRQADAGWDRTSTATDISAQISMSPTGFRLTPNPEGVITLAVTGGSGYVSARKAY